MKKAALLCASGIGDGLLMMIGAHHLKLAGYLPTIFHDAAKDLSLLFESDTFIPHVPFEDLENTLNRYDQVIVENDNSERAWYLFRLRNKGRLKHMTFFFPTDSKNMKEGDFLFNPKLSVAINLSLACQKTLGTPDTKENDLTLPKDKIFKKYPKRIIIHPTSNDPKKNWKQKQFLSLAKKLQKEEFSIVFCVSPIERKYWEGIEGISLPKFSSLKEVKEYIYESGFLIGNDSGLGHLASNLGIPTLTVSGNPKQMRLWRPDWTLGKVATLPFPLPNFKGINLRTRENFWQNFVSVSRVYQTFIELASESCRHML
ncbi:MAG: glycosyltransferase family 9 protein [Candidatus Neptunochlamydia sp.]|nr:glycosyltransferase family 9 protein [Candidatus Neptunochlamydia sp.]